MVTSADEMSSRLSTTLETVLADAVLEVPLRQRAKFEGWLKMELAHALQGGTDREVAMEVEFPASKGRAYRADLQVSDAGDSKAYVMLKTPNTNFRFDGVESKTRPITKNVAEIGDDVEKLRDRQEEQAEGYACATFFPVASESGTRGQQMDQYLARIEREGCTLSAKGFVQRGSDWGIAWYVWEVPRTASADSRTSP